jgi:hypothetical protein
MSSPKQAHIYKSMFRSLSLFILLFDHEYFSLYVKVKNPEVDHQYVQVDEQVM